MIRALVAALLLLTGIAVILFAAHRWRQWRRVRDWQPVPGEVVEARVKEIWDFGHGMPSRAPEVAYRYAYGAGAFTGSRITVHDRHLASLDSREVQAVLDRIGRHPDVYVDPANPASTVLVNQLGKAHVDYLLTRLGIGVLLVAACVALLTLVPAD